MRLRRSDLQRPGLSRRRRGSGWSYVDADGHPVDAETRQRISSLVIPPAWQDVWISPYPNGHIQAVGTDAAGRRQYLYHEQWRLTRDELKHARVLTLARRLPKVRQAIETDLVRPRLDRDRVLATALRMLDYGLFRSGNESYTEDNGSHGVATLLREHVIARRDQVAFDFPAKSGVARSLTLVDAPLADAVRALRRARTGTDRLLVYRCDGGWGEIHADTVNERFKELAGAGLHRQGPAHLAGDRRCGDGVLASGAPEHQGGPHARRADRHGGRGPGAGQHPCGRPQLVRRPAGGRDLRPGPDDRAGPVAHRHRRPHRPRRTAGGGACRDPAPEALSGARLHIG